MEYTVPPFSITAAMLVQVAEISEKLGRIGRHRPFEARPQLRRNNRIRSIQASLAIEANSLSVDEVRSVIGGKAVEGPEREIREVQNAYRAYESLGTFDPYSLQELLRLHGMMTEGTLRESGVFRSHGEGVFQGNRCIFMAPPPSLVPEQTAALFAWMNRARSELHALILSSVFHYEFVFIHPFADGNGRMARLWQTALLSEWNPVFLDLPLESRIQEFQDEYYAAIAACHSNGNSDVFVEFMLSKINAAIDALLAQLDAEEAALSPVQKLLSVMDEDVPYPAAWLMKRLGLQSRDHFRKHYLAPALEAKRIERTDPARPTSRNQCYIKKS